MKKPILVMILIAATRTGASAQPGEGSGARSITGLWSTGSQGGRVKLYHCGSAICGKNFTLVNDKRCSAAAGPRFLNCYNRRRPRCISRSSSSIILLHQKLKENVSRVLTYIQE